jgi:crossover junction endodeoxyribonuclease RusA
VEVAVIELVLPYPISANRYWRPVRIGAHITIVPTSDAKAYKRQVEAATRAAGIAAPLQGRVTVSIRLYPQRPQDWQRRARLDPIGWADSVRCIDLDNARKVLYDALKGVAFEDDSRVWRDSGERMEPDGEARVVVRIAQISRPVAQQMELAA